MIEIKKVNKWFNKHKKNKIHVINNTSLSLEDNGLVAILGPSGCGKTTLLNTIGGLDKINSGSIYIDGEKIAKRSSRKVDKIRNLNIGYIFQDYKLVDSMTVFENVALSLKLIGVKDKEEIKNRVYYTLDKVNMLRYKSRPVNMLSGGERQRVGIARALVKNPKIIIADEPTGNLDSKNSLEVMNIIKSISEKYLVILVTHEEELARFFADRIIELKDGVVTNDYKNSNENILNYELENQIYLKDYKNIDSIKEDNIKIDVYRDSNEKLNVKIIFKNGNIYISSSNDEKLEVIDNNSSIEIINDYKKEIKKVEVNKDTFNIESVYKKDYKKKYSSIFKIGGFISYGFKKILEYPLIKKILLGGFFLSGMFIFYSVSQIFATLNIEDKDFIEYNREYLTATVKKVSVDKYLDFESLEDVIYIIPGDSNVNFAIEFDKFLQSYRATSNIIGSLSSISMVDSSKLILGRMPENENEILLDNFLLEKFIDDNDTNTAGFMKCEDFVNHKVKLRNLQEFTIVGIVENEGKNIYAYDSMFINIIANSNKSDDYFYNDTVDTTASYIDYNLFVDKNVKLKKGRLPINDYEVLLNINHQYEYNLNSKINEKVNGHKLKVVGFYEELNGYQTDLYLVNNNTIKYNLIKNNQYFTIYSSNKAKTVEDFRENNINVKDSYEYSKESYKDSRKDSVISTLIASGVILLISLVEILLMIRSSFLSRIKEVGIFRAIGVKKTDIYKMFTGEILAITVIASFTGILFMAYILYSLSSIKYLETMYMINIFTIGLSLILVLIFNLLVGLIPVYNTIRKTPASILARVDVD